MISLTGLLWGKLNNMNISDLHIGDEVVDLDNMDEIGSVVEITDGGYVRLFIHSLTKGFLREETISGSELDKWTVVPNAYTELNK